MEKPIEHTVPPEIEPATQRVAPLYEMLDVNRSALRPLRQLIDECIERARAMSADE